MLDWLLNEEVMYLIPPMVLLLVLCLVLVIRQHRQRRASAIRLQSRSGARIEPRQRLVGITLNAIMLFSGFFVVLHTFNLLFLPYPRVNEDFDVGNLISSAILFTTCIGLHQLNRARSSSLSERKP